MQRAFLVPCPWIVLHLQRKPNSYVVLFRFHGRVTKISVRFVFIPGLYYICSANQIFVYMKNKILVSVRIDPHVLEVIDSYCEVSSFRTRSELLNAGAALMAEALKRGMDRSIRRFDPKSGDKCDKFEFEFHREHR